MTHALYVFISHSSQNNAIAQQLAERLRQHGIQAWVDVEQLHTGDDWLAQLEQAITGCRAVIVLLSDAARSSKWVRRETMMAMELGRPLFIALLERVPMPLHLFELQYTDFTKGDFEAAAQDLVDDLRPLFVANAPKPHRIIIPIPDENNFFSYLAQLSPEHATVARRVYEWGQCTADEVAFSGRHIPLMHLRAQLGMKLVTMCALTAYPRNPALMVPFDVLSAYAPFDTPAERQAILAQLNALLPTSEQVSADRADRRPTITLATLVDETRLAAVLALLDTIYQRLKATSPTIDSR